MSLAARVFVAAFVLALVPLAAGAAGAATLSDPPSAVSQYIYTAPTADGNPTPGNKSASLSPSAARALEGANQGLAAALRTVGTSPGLGASTLALPKSARISPKQVDASFAGSLKETLGSLVGGGRSLGLLAGLLVISGAVAVMARRKHRPAS